MRFRKKPLVIEAWQLRRGNAALLLDKIVSYLDAKKAWLVYNDNYSLVGICIETLEGVMRADLEDYIIKGIKGEFYPCKKDIFEATYEELEEGLDARAIGDAADAIWGMANPESSHIEIARKAVGAYLEALDSSEAE